MSKEMKVEAPKTKAEFDAYVKAMDEANAKFAKKPAGTAKGKGKTTNGKKPEKKAGK